MTFQPAYHGASEFKPGDRVKLVRCTDEYTKLSPGEEGTVVLVDPLATVHVKWDSGSNLGICLDAGDLIVKS